MPAVIFNGQTVRTLKDGIKLGNGSTIVSGILDPSSGAGFAAAVGDLYLSTTTGKTYQKNGAPDTSWVELITEADIQAIQDQIDAIETDFLKLDGTNAMTGNLDVDHNTIVNMDSLTIGDTQLSSGSLYTNGDASYRARFNLTLESSQLGDVTVSTSSGNVIIDPSSDLINVSGSIIRNAQAGVSGNDVVIKSQLDDKADQSEVDDLVALTGVSSGSIDLGSFTGSIISDNETIKGALQDLETFIEALPDPIVYQGTWNASTNTPTLSNSDVGAIGHLYRVTVAGTANFGAGPISFEVADSVVNNGTIWEKWDHSDQVSSVFGRVGDVVGASGDYTAIQVNYDNTSSGLVATNVQDAIDEVSDIVLTGTPLTLAGYDASGDLYSVPNWDIIEEIDGLRSQTSTDGTDQTNLRKVELSTTFGNGTSGSIDDYVDLKIDNATNANYEIGSYSSISTNLNLANSSTVDSLTVVSNSADGIVTGNSVGLNQILDLDTQNLTGINLDHNGTIANSYVGVNVNGQANAQNSTGIQLARSGIVTNEVGIRIESASDAENKTGISTNIIGSVNNQLELLNLSASASVSGNSFVINSYSNSNVTGSLNVLNHLNDGVVSQNYNGISLYNNEDIGQSYNGTNLVNSGNVTTQVQGHYLLNSGTANGYNGVYLSNTGVISSYINGVTVYDESSSPTASMVGMDLNINGDYDSVKGININVSGATANERKVGLNVEGGSINGFSPFTTISDIPSVVDSGNVIVTNFEVDSGSPVSGTSVIANNLSGLAVFNDNYSGDPFYNLGYAMVGFVGQLSVETGKTVETVSMALSGASIPASSNGGTVNEVIMFNAKGILNAGGTINIDTAYGLKVDASLSSMSPTQAYGIYVEDANADNYFEGDIVKINGLDTSFPTIQGVSGSVLTNDGSGNLTWEEASIGASGDIADTAFTGANNVVTPTDITSFLFNNGVVRSFEAQVSVYVDATTPLYEKFSIDAIQHDTGWYFSVVAIGADSGVDLTITNSGQVQYTSGNYAGFNNLRIKFRAFVTGV